MSKDSNQRHNMSVEEILQSIKGIIDCRTDVIQANDDILELTDIFVDKDTEKTDKLQGNLKFNNVLEDDRLKSPLVSNQSAAKTINILQQFAKTAQEVAKDVHKPKTLEDLVVEMIHPQLSQWLDVNLPLLVQQIVEKELKRLRPNNQK